MNSVDQDLPCFLKAFNLGAYFLSKFPVRGFQYTKGLRAKFRLTCLFCSFICSHTVGTMLRQ